MASEATISRNRTRRPGTANPRPTADQRRHPATTHRPRGAARREALLEAVLQIVGEVGPDAVTHRRVAEVAQLPLASTTYWFDSKEHLLTAALELAAERDVTCLRVYAERAAESGVDPLEAAVTVVAEAVETPAQTNRRSMIATFALLVEAARRPALQEVSRRWTEIYLVTVGTFLAEAGSRQPRDDAELLIGAADGLIIDQLAGGVQSDLRPALRRLAAALVSAP